MPAPFFSGQCHAATTGRLARWSLSCRAESVPVRQPLLSQSTTVEIASPLPPLPDWNDQRQWVTARWCEKPLMEDRQTAIQSFHLVLMKWLRLTEWFTSPNLKATQLNFLEKDHCCNLSSGLQLLWLGSRPRASVFDNLRMSLNNQLSFSRNLHWLF